MTEISDLLSVLDKQAELIDELGAMARAYEHCYKSFGDKWVELVKEGQQMIADHESGEPISMEAATENLIKTKLMREVVCFMGETLEAFRKGDGEC